MYRTPRYLPAGDRALSIELGDEISPEINRRVHSLSRAIEASGIPGVVDLVPTYRALLVYYDPLTLSLAELMERLAGVEQTAGQAVPGTARVVEIPALYGGEYGPDLEFVADHSGLSQEEVVRVHTGMDYLIYGMGFTPGFAYLGGMSERIATPRLQTPRTLIPAGSVGIAERQTGVYPIASPGGWRLIGRTPVQLFDAGRDPPVLAGPGDYVRFVPLTEKAYRDVERQVQAGSYQVIIRDKDQGVEGH